jgi:peroxiredoxin
MNERSDQLSGLARVLDRPVDPRPEFADALLERLLEELAQTDGAPAGHGISWPRRALPGRLRRPLLAGAVALAVAAAVIATVVVSRPSPASALDVIRQARAAFAHMPPFQAIYKVALNPDGTNPGGPRYVKKGATATVAVSYGGRGRLRTQIGAGHGFTSDLSPGSYQIDNGHWFGVYDAKSHHFFSTTTSGSSAETLDYLSWRGAYPDWERVCRGPYSKVFADTRIVGRDARHIRCGDVHGDVWELWIDRQTGLLLKIVGQVGGDNFFLGGDIGTSAKGGFEIQKLRYNPTFPKRTFSFPPGTFDPAAAMRATLAKLPPFHAVIADYGPGQHYVDEAWWQNEHTWRTKRLVNLPPRRSANYTGAGSFTVLAHGTEGSYTAHDKTFTREHTPGDAGPALQLLPYLQNQDISPARCPIVGHARIAGRETDHHRCARYVQSATAHRKKWATWEYWSDPATGLALRLRINGRDFVRVRSIQYHPHFPPGTFRFVPPPGSHNANQLEQNPYYKTKLAPGKPAPNWHATTLAGKPFQLTDLRGKPTLVALLADWCPPCSNDLAPLEQAYQHSNGATTVIWVDVGGKAQEAKKLARLNHLPFPGVVDKGAVQKAWDIQSVPEWVLLDSRGRVIEARLGPQTVAQLEHLLARG